MESSKSLIRLPITSSVSLISSEFILWYSVTEILEQWQISKLMPLSVVSFPNLPSINLKVFREFFNTHIFLFLNQIIVWQKSIDL